MSTNGYGGPGQIPHPINDPAGGRSPLEQWDPEGDIISPLMGAEVGYVPAVVRAPPQLPTPEQHPVRQHFPPRGIKAFFDTAQADRMPSSLGFVAHAVQVDNFSNQWLWFPSARRWLPPSYFGFILAIVDGTEVAEWHIQIPAGHAAGTVGTPASPVVTVWFEAYLAPSGGNAMTV